MKRALLAISLLSLASAQAFAAGRIDPPTIDAAESARFAAEVKAEFMHAWRGYRKYAWGHDELLPLSRKPRDWYGKPLLMTPVDALDTLILMGEKQEADAARLAVEAAQRALPGWRSRSALERGRLLTRWAQLMRQHAEDLAQLMTAEQGKPLAEAKGEVGYGASFLEWFAEEAKRVYGETIPTTDNNKRYLVIKQAMGVCAAITPWNFPSAMLGRKLGPALAGLGVRRPLVVICSFTTVVCPVRRDRCSAVSTRLGG